MIYSLNNPLEQHLLAISSNTVIS